MSKVNIKKLKPSDTYKNGKYYPTYPQKYIGDIHNIIYRSSWELKFCQYCDLNNNILNWSSECVSIEYWNPVLKKTQNYYPDYYIKVKKQDKTEENWLIEIKPSKQFQLEQKPEFKGNVTEKKLKEYNDKLKMWITNRAKFEAATRFAKGIGYSFGTIDENFLFK